MGSIPDGQGLSGIGAYLLIVGDLAHRNQLAIEWVSGTHPSDIDG